MVNPYQTPPDCGEYNKLFDPAWWFQKIGLGILIAAVNIAMLPIALLVVLLFIIIGSLFLLFVSPFRILVSYRSKCYSDESVGCCVAWVTVLATSGYLYLRHYYDYDIIAEIIIALVRLIRRLTQKPSRGVW